MSCNQFRGGQELRGNTHGRNLKELRKKRNLSQESLAEKAGVSVSTIQTIESYSPAFTQRRVRVALAMALEVDPTDIWSSHETMKLDRYRFTRR